MKRMKLAWVVGLALCGLCQASTIYVSPSGNDANNGSSWVLAKQTIQAGVNVAASNGIVLVTNGTYVLTGQITVSNAITVRSVNGPEVTIVNGNGQVTLNRCFHLEENCVLDGFTITNGFSTENGGGVSAVSSNAVIKNCVLAGNTADKEGGGVYQGVIYSSTIIGNLANYGGGAGNSILHNCTISGNTARRSGGGTSGITLNNCTISGNMAPGGGGVFFGTLNNCLVSGNVANGGGGTANSILNNCLIVGNLANYDGGGASAGTLNNCTISGNAANYGGGASGSTLNNCLIVGNLANYDGGGVSGETLNNCTISGNTAHRHGGGASGSTLNLNNCIVYYNSGQNNIHGGTIRYTCAPDAPSGFGNITDAPMFVDKYNGNYRLSAVSPCINAGHNMLAPTNVPQVDLDGNPRIFNGTVDMGAYETGANPPYPVVVGTSILANGQRGTVQIQKRQPLTLAITMSAGHLSGTLADWWVVAVPHNGPFWYYLNSDFNGMDFPVNDLTALQPAYRGALFNITEPFTIMPATTTLPVGVFDVYFLVDKYDGVLNYPEPNTYLMDSVRVIVQ